MCACGTRFITHKVAALDHTLGRFGAYISYMYLIALIEDPSTKSAQAEIERICEEVEE